MLSVWVPKKEILLTPVGYVTFKTAGPKDDLVIVPWSAIAELAGAGAEPLDEKHLRLLPCSGPRGRPSWHVRRKSRSPQTP